MTDMVHHYIGGQVYEGTSGKFGDVFNPATGEKARQVSFATADEVRKAIDAAADAFGAWSRTPALRRARVMFRFKELLDKHHDDLARIITAEHGKTFSDAQGEVTRGLEVVEFACGITHLQKGEFSENVGTNIDSYSMRQPLGVCAGITPFNFPIMVPMWMIPLTIGCGNTFILKPSEHVPCSAIRLAEIFTEAGLPDGVFNIVNGSKNVVEAICDHPDIQAVAFVGSSNIAETVYKRATGTGKRALAP